MKQIYKTMKKIPLIASLAFLIGCSTVSEPKPFTSEIDPYAYTKEYMRWYINEMMDENDIVGLSIALVDDQKIVWSEGFGYQDKVKGIKATPQTRYRAGSITKLFNAMAVMKLSEAGKMNIDKPLKTYLPEFSIKSRFGSTANITPRNIMTHHSGLPSDWLDRFFATNPLPYTEYVKVIQNEYVATMPNTIMSYSNLGITLLGHSVEKVSGMKYAEYINKVLFRPMEMKYSEIKMALYGDYASKSYKEYKKETTEYAIGAIPAGGLNTSVEELSHLAIMINAKGMYKKHRVLKSSTLNKMFKIQNKNVALDVGLEMGLGYFIDKTLLGAKDTLYYHGGDTFAQHAYFAVTPHTKLGVVVMTNSIDADAPKIARELMKKAWEAKSGKKLIVKKKIIKETSDFEGIYASILGKVTIKKKGEKYDVITPSASFSLARDKFNSYRAKYKLLGLIPISIDEITKIRFYTKDIRGEHVIVGSIPSGTVIAGVKVKPHKIPPRWIGYLGKYKILNNLEPEGFKIQNLVLKIDNKGYLLFESQMESGESISYILKPVNDTEAIVEGLGRGMQETIYYKDGVFHYAGLKFKKIAK